MEIPTINLSPMETSENTGEDDMDFFEDRNTRGYVGMKVPDTANLVRNNKEATVLAHSDESEHTVLADINPGQLNNTLVKQQKQLTRDQIHAIEAKSEAHFMTTVETRDYYKDPRLYAMVETKSHDIVLYEVPPSLLNSSDTSLSTTVIDDNKTIVIYRTKDDFSIPPTTLPYHLTRHRLSHRVQPRICRSLYTICQPESAHPIGVVETKWTCRTTSSPGPYCRMDKRRSSTSAAYINAIRLASVLVPSIGVPSLPTSPPSITDSMTMVQVDETTASNSTQASVSMMSIDDIYKDPFYDVQSDLVTVGRDIGLAIKASLGHPGITPRPRTNTD